MKHIRTILRYSFLSSDIRCDFLIDQVLIITVYHFLQMKPYLEMQKGKCTDMYTPYNLALDVFGS